MRILMLYPKYPKETFWDVDRSAQRFFRTRGTMPPLGLLTLASYLPDDFHIRLVDRNIAEETDEDWRWADVAFLSLMLVQKRDYERCVSRAREFGVPIAVGGPFTSAEPERVAAEAEWVCYGEAETIVEEFVSDLRNDCRWKQYQGGNRTDLKQARVPRYELLPDINDYCTMSVQFSRGCPYECEFCDVIAIYGRVPRTKSPEHMLEELDTIKRLGFRGCIFWADDNFLGNKREALRMLREVARWNQENRYPYYFFTQGSINLGRDEMLMNGFAEANFLFLFIGIETPDAELLKTTGKVPNLQGEALELIRAIREHGVHVIAGLMFGFDGERQDVFERQKAFIQASGIGVLMISLLEALPGTALSRRMQREGRLLPTVEVHLNHTLEGINFIPKGEMTKRMYLERLADLQSEVYHPKAFFERILPAMLTLRKRVSTPVRLRTLMPLLRQIYRMGFREKEMRRHFWNTFLQILKKNVSAVGAFHYDCFHYYHLYLHHKHVEKSLREYLLRPEAGDVLDQVIPLSASAEEAPELTGLRGPGAGPDGTRSASERQAGVAH